MRTYEDDSRKDGSTSRSDSTMMDFIVPPKFSPGGRGLLQFMASDDNQRILDDIAHRAAEMSIKELLNARTAYDHCYFYAEYRDRLYFEKVECVLERELNRLIAEYDALGEKGRANFDTKPAWYYKILLLIIRSLREYTLHAMPKVRD